VFLTIVLHGPCMRLCVWNLKALRMEEVVNELLLKGWDVELKPVPGVAKSS